MDISAALKQKFIDRDGIKIVKLEFPSLNLTINTDKIYEETLNLEERLLSGNSIEFVGCLSSIFSIEVHDVTQNLKNQKIIASITMQGEEEWIPLFVGYVDSVKTRLEDSWKGLTCYDELYYKAADVDISTWYNTLLPSESSTVSLGDFRESLFTELGITQVETELPNDDLIIKKEYDPKTLNALKTIKSICQINGVFGIINREGLFEYRHLAGITYSLNPSDETNPGEEVFPGVLSDEEESIPLYMKMEYEDFDVVPINKVLLRDSENDAGIAYGTGSNVYIVQNNMFVYGLSDATKVDVARNIYSNVAGLGYRPFEATNMGYPFLEVGTRVKYMVQDYTSGGGTLVEVSSFVMNRRLKGIQFLTDRFNAVGEEFQKAFITDLQAQIDMLRRNSVDPDDYYTKDDMDTMMSSYMPLETAEEAITEITDTALAQMTQPTTLAVQSVYTLPSTRSANTIYLVQGGVIVQ